jgi:hypothetical protein
MSFVHGLEQIKKRKDKNPDEIDEVPEETGDFDAKTNRFELTAEYPMGADLWRQRTVIEVASPDRMTASSFLSFGGVPEWKAVEIRYTRRK